MTSALRYEWLRLTTIRSTWWVTAIALGLSAGLSLLLGLGISSDSSAVTDPSAYAAVLTQGASTTFVPLLLAYLMGMVGVFTFGHEFRHGMVRATLTAVPQRWAVVSAKVLVTIAWTAAAAVLSLALATVMGLLTLGGDGFSVAAEGVPRALLGYVAYTVLFTLTGMGLAGLIRHQGAAMALLFVIPLVVENVLRLLLTLPDAFNGVEGVVRYFPFDAGVQMMALIPIRDLEDIFGPAPLSPAGGAAVFAAFTGLVVGLTAVTFVRRDA